MWEFCTHSGGLGPPDTQVASAQKRCHMPALHAVSTTGRFAVIAAPLQARTRPEHTAMNTVCLHWTLGPLIPLSSLESCNLSLYIMI